MSLDHSPARGSKSLNLLKGAPAIAVHLGPQFSARVVRYLHETGKLKSIFQLGGTGPLYALPDRLDEELREHERQRTAGTEGWPRLCRPGRASGRQRPPPYRRARPPTTSPRQASRNPLKRSVARAK